MIIGEGAHQYRWVDRWAGIPATPSAESGWAHHDVVITGDGRIVAYHQGDPRVLIFDQEGNLLESWDSGLTEGHGMTLVQEDGGERLWLADPGRKRRKENGYQYPAQDAPLVGRVVKAAPSGEMLMELPPPDLPVYREGNYCPTSVAVHEERLGGNGDIWVADGYGQSYVHRYDKSGKHLASINGEEGHAGAFNCAHGIWIDRRKRVPELYIADRSNCRVQVYDMEVRFQRSFGQDFLTSPSAFAVLGDDLLIAELRARLAVVDGNDRLVCYLGDNSSVAQVEGWPNVPAERIDPGRFNSPHGIAVDGDGNIYVAEWLIGGRITKLVKV